MSLARFATVFIAVLLCAHCMAIPKGQNVIVNTCGPGMAVVVIDARTRAEVMRTISDGDGGAVLRDLIPGHLYFAYVSDPGPFPVEVPKVLLIDPSRPQAKGMQCEAFMPNYMVRDQPVTFVLTSRSGKPLRYARVWAYRYPGSPTWAVAGRTDSRGKVTLRVPSEDAGCVVGVQYRDRYLFAHAHLPHGLLRPRSTDRAAGAAGRAVTSGISSVVAVEFAQVE